MNTTVREQIRELDVKNGGGIISDKIRIDNIDQIKVARKPVEILV